MGFLYILGLMFLAIFGAAMLFYPLFAGIMRASGGKYRKGENSQRKDDCER